MRWRDEVRARLRRHHPDPDEDVVLELAQHAEAEDEAARADGLSDAAARERVAALIDGWSRDRTALVHRLRTPRMQAPPPPAGSPGLTGLWLDIRHALRMVRAHPWTSTLAWLTMVLAVGATATLASVTYGVLARPLPWPDADRLVRIVESREGGTAGRAFLTNVGFHTWRDSATTIDGLAGYSAATVTLDAGGGPQRVPGASATASLFGVLGAAPLRGRLFTDDDEIRDGVVLISEDLWRRQFGAADDTVGRVITLGGNRVTIVGILPGSFGFPERETDVWSPLHVPALALVDGVQTSLSMFSGLGRLRPGASAEAASREATAAVRNGPPVGMVGTAVFGSDGPAVVIATPLARSMTGAVRPALLVLLAGVTLLFAAAIGGLASMQVARSVARRREVAIRVAIGAGSGRIARQTLVEHLLVGFAGGAGGLALAAGLHAAAPALLPADFPRAADIVLDGRMVALTAALALGASLVMAVVPVLQARQVDLASALTEGGLAPLGGHLRTPVVRLRSAVMAGQVAVTLVLLVGALLLGRSFISLVQVDRGYDPSHLLTARLTLDERSRPAIAEAIVARLRTLPGVRAAAFGGAAPFMPGGAMLGLTLDASASGADQPEPRRVSADFQVVSPGFVEALGMRVLEGRTFSETDSATSEAVLMVNAAFAREYLAGDAIGRSLPLEALGLSDGRIIGIVADVAASDVSAATTPLILASSRQVAGSFGVADVKIVVRTDDDPEALVPMLRSMARDLAPTAPLDQVMTMEDRLASSLARPRLYALLLGGFSGFALLIAAVGLFAVLSHAVNERRREMGVRLALGATPAGLLRLVLRDGLRLTAAGALGGTVAAWLMARSVESLLFGVAARDVTSYALGLVIVTAGAVLACAGPALRASRVDPIRVLRDG